MEYTDLPFPKPEDSSSRYVRKKVRGPVPESFEDPTPLDDPLQSKNRDPIPRNHVVEAKEAPKGTLDTWRRFMLADAMKRLRVEDMPPLLLDELLDKLLFESRIEIGRFWDLAAIDWARPDHG